MSGSDTVIRKSTGSENPESSTREGEVGDGEKTSEIERDCKAPNIGIYGRFLFRTGRNFLDFAKIERSIREQAWHSVHPAFRLWQT